ncbi:MAG: capsular polysaccharide biosynthesis protein [Paracoccaceae bacterium]|nr:capsular polysaccharide biosynthesis protein [Paracoccaceae bacterium]
MVSNLYFEGADVSDFKRAFVYNGGFFKQKRVRRMLTLSGYQISLGLPQKGDVVAVWGNSPTSYRGTYFAQKYKVPLLRIEDTFLRSLFPGQQKNEAPLGILLDRSGVHFDAKSPSDLEKILSQNPLDDERMLKRAKSLISRIKENHLTKYSAFDPDANLPSPGYVLVIDQSRGDASVTASNDSQEIFDAMLRAAKEDYQNHRIVIKTHPEAQAGLRSGYYGPSHYLGPEVHLYQNTCSPWALLDGAIAVYTLSSQFGFEAILNGHRPVVFGQPFYAGWGLSEDVNPPPRRNRKLNAEQLFMAVMMIYSKWYDPYRDRMCSLECALDTFEATTRSWREDHKGWQAYKIRMWKRKPLRQFFGQHGRVSFVSSMVKSTRLASTRKLVWAGSGKESDKDIIRIEDGFLRSRGLGAELTPPLSLSCDDLGIYYDPSQESRLERLIKSSILLREDQIDRIKRLKNSLINQQLTKYNLPGKTHKLPAGKQILVPGQVEDGASVLRGTQRVQTNLDLLRVVRSNNPNDIIIYKPHPDVEAKLRKGRIPLEQALLYADAITDNADVSHLLSEVAEVHTMTSLTGFEALLRGLKITTYGVPFYAGWGLTTDKATIPARRNQCIDLDSLIYATLIAYPRYFDPVTKQACPVEVVVDRLSESQALPRSKVNRLLAKVQGLLATPHPFWR